MTLEPQIIFISVKPMSGKGSNTDDSGDKQVGENQTVTLQTHTHICIYVYIYIYTLTLTLALALNPES